MDVEGQDRVLARRAGQDEGLAGATAKQSRAAAEEADLILFVVDGREGASSLDDDILRWLRKLSKPTLLIVNKTDGIDQRAAQAIKALYATGFFKDVRLEQEGDVLVVTVQERPAIAQIDFSGNKAFPSDKMKEGLKQIGLAAHNSHDTVGQLPTGGKNGCEAPIHPNVAAANRQPLTRSRRARRRAGPSGRPPCTRKPSRRHPYW